MSKKMKTRKGKDNINYPYTSPDIVIDSAGESQTTKNNNMKTDINNIKTDLGTEELTTTAKNVKGAVNEVAAQYKDIANNKADKVATDNIQQQVNNLVLGAVGDGNNAEVVQARGSYTTLNARLDSSDKGKLNKIDFVVDKYNDNYTAIDESTLKFNVGYNFNTDGEMSKLTNQDWWCVSDYIQLPNKGYLEVKGYSDRTTPTAIVVYNSSKEIVEKIKTKNPDDVGSTFPWEKVIISKEINPEYSYVRVLGNYYNGSYRRPAYANEYTCQNTQTNRYKPYSAGTIFFTVNVNQDFADTTSITTATNDSETMKPVYCALKLPTNYSNEGTPTKIAVVMHGAGGKVTDNNAGEMKLFMELVNNGYAIFDVNGSNNEYTDGTSDHMGSSRTISAYLKAFEWIKNNYNVEDKLYVHGHSMGGLTALNFAAKNPYLCKVLGLYHPVVDMYNQAWLHPWFSSTKQAIASEYNFDDKTGNTYEKDKVIGYNPIENNSILIDGTRYNYLPCPIKIWHGNADTTVSLSGSQEYIKALKNNGCEAHLRVVDKVTHSYVNSMHKELVMWFNRH